MTTAFTAGVDWGSRKHHVCVMDHQGKVVKERAFDHGGRGLAAMTDWLLDCARRPANLVKVAIEVPHGPVVETLMECGFPVHSINPMQLDRFRDRFSAAGAKDDRRDAKALASALRTDPDCLRPVRESDDAVIEMRGAARARKELVEDRNRIANRFRQHLLDYYPQFLDAVDGDVSTPWAIALWKRVPTPQKARRTRKTTLAKLLRKHRIRRIDADELADRLQAQPIKRRNASVECARNRILSLLPILRQYNAQLRQAKCELQRTLQLAKECLPDDSELRDAAILASIPGVGDHVLATLMTEAEHALGQRNCAALQCLSGVAPVTVSSGNSRRVRQRRAKNQRLADAVYHWARVAVQRDAECRNRYDLARARGKTHGHALRIVGDRLIRIACAMLRNRTPFHPHHGRRDDDENAPAPAPEHDHPDRLHDDHPATTPREPQPCFSIPDAQPGRPTQRPTRRPDNTIDNPTVDTPQPST